MSQEVTPFRLVSEEKQQQTTNEPSNLQFDQAEFTTPAATATTCTQCNQALSQSYYALADKVLCQRCRNKLLAERQSGSPMVRVGQATVCGLLAAIVGSALYFAVFTLTGYELGLIAIVVGIMVGTAVKWGADGRGGWGYQALAILLTYCAIVTSYIPPIIQGIRQTAVERSQPQPEAKATAAKAETPVANIAQAQKPENTAPADSADEEQASSQRLAQLAHLSNFQLALVILPFAFLSPIFGGFENLIGLVIIAIGLYEAWKLTKYEEFAITGPFALNTTVPHAATH